MGFPIITIALELLRGDICDKDTVLVEAEGLGLVLGKVRAAAAG